MLPGVIGWFGSAKSDEADVVVRSRYFEPQCKGIQVICFARKAELNNSGTLSIRRTKICNNVSTPELSG